MPDFDALSSALDSSSASTSCLNPAMKLSLLASVSPVDRPRFQTVAESIWTTVESKNRAEALSALINGLTFLHLFKNDYPALQLSREQFDWLLDLFLSLPDLEELSGSRELGNYLSFLTVSGKSQFNGLCRQFRSVSLLKLVKISNRFQARTL